MSYASGTFMTEERYQQHKNYMLNKGIHILWDKHQYVDAHQLLPHRCVNGHEWNANYLHTRGPHGTGCRKCSYISFGQKQIISKEVFKEHVDMCLSNSIQPLYQYSDYKNMKTKYPYKCLKCSNVFYSTFEKLRGTSCEPCRKTNHRFLQSLVFDEKIKHHGIIRLGDYIDNNTPIYFLHTGCGHEFPTRPRIIMNTLACPLCKSTGYKTNKKAIFYILLFDSYIKYGITNNLPKRRNRHLNSNGAHRVVYEYHHNDGMIIKLIEDYIKAKFGGRYVSQQICPDGFTETLPIEMLPLLINAIENIKEST